MRVVEVHMRITIPSEIDNEAKGWQDLANCLGVDPDLFFPERGASTREAKEVCRGCVVRAECLEYALVNGEKFGIWGGMSERERRRIRRQRALARRAAGAAALRWRFLSARSSRVGAAPASKSGFDRALFVEVELLPSSRRGRVENGPRHQADELRAGDRRPGRGDSVI